MRLASSTSTACLDLNSSYSRRNSDNSRLATIPSPELDAFVFSCDLSLSRRSFSSSSILASRSPRVLAWRNFSTVSSFFCISVTSVICSANSACAFSARSLASSASIAMRLRNSSSCASYSFFSCCKRSSTPAASLRAFAFASSSWRSYSATMSWCRDSASSASDLTFALWREPSLSRRFLKFA